MINFGLDFDGTVSEDPELFRQFVTLALLRGHFVYVTTARHVSDTEEIEAALPGIEIIASGGQPKKWAADQAGVSIDVWIDDMPQVIME